MGTLAESHWTDTSNLGKLLFQHCTVGCLEIGIWWTQQLDRNSLFWEFTIFDIFLKGFLDNIWYRDLSKVSGFLERSW